MLKTDLGIYSFCVVIVGSESHSRGKQSQMSLKKGKRWKDKAFLTSCLLNILS